MKTRLLRLLPTLVVGAVCVASLYAAVRAVAVWRERGTPHIGDMIVFRGAVGGAVGGNGGSASGGSGGKRLDVRTRDGGRCVLEIGALRGGSLMVEGPVLGVDGHFRVHWAGLRTARDAGDCGHEADLLLDARQLEMLRAGAASPDSGA